MESPQAENGHTDIANEIIEALAGIRISGEEWQILCVVFRKTYGWHKKEDWISLFQFQEMTGLKKPNIIRAIKKLLSKGIIIKKDNAKPSIIKKDNAYGASYGFQKDYSKWRALSKKITQPSSVIKNDNRALSKMIPTKESSITKENKKEKSTLEESFKIFYQAYPRKDAKKKALDIWFAIKPSPETLEKMLSKIEYQKTTPQWTKDGGDFIPYPTTWLNGRRWEDEGVEVNGFRHLTETELNSFEMAKLALSCRPYEFFLEFCKERKIKPEEVEKWISLNLGQ